MDVRPARVGLSIDLYLHKYTCALCRAGGNDEKENEVDDRERHRSSRPGQLEHWSTPMDSRAAGNLLELDQGRRMAEQGFARVLGLFGP